MAIMTPITARPGIKCHNSRRPLGPNRHGSVLAAWFFGSRDFELTQGLLSATTLNSAPILYGHPIDTPSPGHSGDIRTPAIRCGTAKHGRLGQMKKPTSASNIPSDVRWVSLLMSLT